VSARPWWRDLIGCWVAAFCDQKSGFRGVRLFWRCTDSSLSVLLPIDPQKLFGFGAKRRQLFKQSPVELALPLDPADRSFVVVAGPRGLAQAVVAHGKEIQVVGQPPVRLTLEVWPENLHHLAIATGSIISHTERVGW
jgi:hypothetical protein